MSISSSNPWNCLVCGEGGARPVHQLAPNIRILTPFVRAHFGGANGQKITVGNDSWPGRPGGMDNTAAIKSFTFGASTGMTAEFEIIDELGGSFDRFARDAIGTEPDSVGGTNKVSFQYGWIYGDSSTWASAMDANGMFAGSFQAQIAPSPNAYAVGYVANLKVNYEGTQVTYSFTVVDMMQHAFVSRSVRSFPETTLKEAIRQLAEEGTPKFPVKFLRRNPDGTEGEDWEFNDAGVRRQLQASNQNKLATIQAWIAAERTNGPPDNNGIVMLWDAAHEGGRLVLMEDPGLSLNAKAPPASIGTFIVGGGGCSNVLEFRPEMNLLNEFGRHGVGGGIDSAGGSGSNTAADDKDARELEEAGVMVSVGATEFAIANHGPAAFEQARISQFAHGKAQDLLNSKTGVIKAELRIVGDARESLSRPILWVGQRASVVVINPMHMRRQAFQRGDKSEVRVDWTAASLSGSACNDIMTSQNWFVEGVSHNISLGTFTTTLQLSLRPGQ